jgi:hypothetical protein
LPHPSNAVFINSQESENINNKFDYEIFTDGLKCDAKVGAAFCIFHNNIELTSEMFCLSPLRSVFQSELIAIKQSIICLKLKIENDISIYDNKKIVICIYSDSQSAISSLKQSNPTHPIVFEIKNLIKSLENKTIFYLKWVKGHSGTFGNERADTLAKEGSNKNIIESTYNLFPKSTSGLNHFKNGKINGKTQLKD